MLLGMPPQSFLLHRRLLPLLIWRSWPLPLSWEWGLATADLSPLRRVLPRTQNLLMQKGTQILLFYSARWFSFSRSSRLRRSGARKHPLSACPRARWPLLGSDLCDQSLACPDSPIFWHRLSLRCCRSSGEGGLPCRTLQFQCRSYPIRCRSAYSSPQIGSSSCSGSALPFSPAPHFHRGPFRFGTLNLKVLPFKPGVGQYIAMHATLTARDFFLANFYPSGPFTCIFSNTSPELFSVLAVANTGFCVGPQNKIGHPVGCRFPC